MVKLPETLVKPSKSEEDIALQRLQLQERKKKLLEMREEKKKGNE